MSEWLAEVERRLSGYLDGALVARLALEEVRRAYRAGKADGLLEAHAMAKGSTDPELLEQLRIAQQDARAAAERAALLPASASAAGKEGA